MKLPTPSFDQIKAAFLGLSRRERMIIVAGLAVLAIAAANGFVFQKQRDEMASIQAQLRTEQATLKQLLADIEAVENGTFPKDAGLALAAELAELRTKRQALDSLLASVKGETPQIGELIRRLIRTQHQRIGLESIKTIAPELLIKQQPPNGSDIYRHGIEVSIRGSYLDVLAYLRSLEGSLDGLFWSGFNLSADGKEVSLRLKIFILSKEAKPILA